MALPATGVIEIRASADANNVNGGGFNSARGGTDYTLQNSAQLTVTDITCTAASTTISSVTGGFTSVMVGNYVHLYSLTGTGALEGWYEIVTFTDGNNVIVDRTPTNGVNNITAGTAKVGGAMSLNSSTAGRTDDSVFEIGVGTNGTGGNKFWIKGNVTIAVAVSIAASGGTQAPIVVEGYTTTRGDGTTAANRPTVTQAANAFTAGSNWDFYNLIFTGTAASQFTVGGGGKIVNCKFTNASTTAGRNAIAAGNDMLFFNNEVISYRGRAITLSNIACSIFDNYIHDSDIGVLNSQTTGDQNIVGNIISDNVTAAIQFSAANADSVHIINNTLYGAENKLGIGLSLATGVTDQRLINNIIYGFVTGVTHADTQSVGYDDYNDYNNNTNDVSAAGQWQKGANDVTTAPGFTSVTQVTGATGKFAAGGSQLIDTSVNFSNLGVSAGETVNIKSGTGLGTAGIYLIDSLTTTTNPNDTLNITIPVSPGTNTVGDKVYQITLGHNFMITGAI